MPTSPAPAPAPTTEPSLAPYTTSLADTPELVRSAQRLRHRVFAEEMGATLHSPQEGVDADALDPHCDHLVVTENPTGEVVGTYRLLPPGRTEQLYGESEFDLSALAPLRPRLVEAGRSCVHPEHRTGAVVNHMWAGIARYVLLSGHRYLAGCASVPLGDGGRAAADVRRLALTRHASPAHLRVHPHRPWTPAEDLAADGGRRPEVPPLLRGYLRLGAWLCGEPAHDPDFGVADFFVLLDTERLSDRHRTFFLGAEAGR